VLRRSSRVIHRGFVTVTRCVELSLTPSNGLLNDRHNGTARRGIEAPDILDANESTWAFAE
jgi:hypothetical protein